MPIMPGWTKMGPKAIGLGAMAFAAAMLGAPASAQPVRATIDTGAVQGARAGDTLVFKGIPYAAPPVGAMRWRPPARPAPWRGVRDATRFAGDAGNVTLFGESAGAGSVQIVMGSPIAKGLFHKAISESGAGGSALFPIRGGALNVERLGQMWAESLGLKDATAEQLRAIPLADVVRNGRAFPFIDGKVVAHSPGEPFYRDAAMRIPLIIGANSNESSLGGMTEAAAKTLLGKDFQPLLDDCVAMTGKPAATAAIDLAEDAGFVLPSFALADRHVAAGNPAYVYEFAQVPVDQRARAAGTDHGGELEYVFGTRPVEHRWDARDAAVSRLMGDYWVRFARTGDPNGDGASRWPRTAALPTTYLAIGATTEVQRLQPLREQAKAAAMADARRKWAAIDSTGK